MAILTRGIFESMAGTAPLVYPRRHRRWHRPGSKRHAVTRMPRHQSGRKPANQEARMAKVAREMVEKAGVNVDQLLELLVKNASAELTTFYYYTILRVNLIGLDGEGVKEIAEAARIEDNNHFEALVPRIYELGGKLPDDMKAFHDLSACNPARLPKDPTDVNEILKVLVEAERCGERGYTHICNMTFGKAHRTYDR